MTVVPFYYYACHLTEEPYGLLQRAIWQKWRGGTPEQRVLYCYVFVLMLFTILQIEPCAALKWKHV